MTYHKSLINGRWHEFTLVEQLANVGSEVERMMKWRAKGNAQSMQLALERCLELLELTIDDPRHRGRLEELTRLRELLLDDFVGNNEYGSTDASWRSYFMWFALVARGRAGK